MARTKARLGEEVWIVDENQAIAQVCAVSSPWLGRFERNRDFTSIDKGGYLRPAANPPSEPGCTVTTSSPFVFPVMMALFGIVS